ncbi:helix-turn-helix domain-containing protein [Salmonella enterica subsp. houtenae serovar 48:z4,z32:-]|nr:Crp/Fnr family transcriptional regulator [Salmonella enterica]EDU9325834.1 helix-turn-helix domain-containing protein [Salmonella enterica subsp. enterica]EEE1664080.1 helix-turn-helix domain-containing protein [Salmonella enterica subsp. houtenae serovar 48:z4,z32:-]EAO1936511.1 Crp/Fnr family transcriptional regulator [Salmonella enterica]EAQ3301186.1 Crp/Fnr family transcriptional regulator [Salmonella enterica]
MMNNAFAQDNNENLLHSFLFSQQAKPHAAIDALFSALLPFGQPFTLGIGDEIYLQENDENYIVLLESGIVSFCRNNNRFHISSAFSPSVLGMVDSYGATYNVPVRPEHFLLAETACTGRFVCLADFIKIADECDLWHDVARCLAYRLMVMSARDRELVGVDSYLKVRTLLIEIWTYPQTYRENIIVLNFIQRRTGISRSRTMKILSELKKGGYIHIDNGRLTALGKLPVAY